MECMVRNPASRRYNRRLFVTMGAYVAVLFTVVWYLKHAHPTGFLLYFLAVLPALPILAVILVVGLYLMEEKDEFQRTVLIQSMLWSIALTLSTTTIWGFLEMFAQTFPFQPYLTFPLFWFYVGVTTPFLKRRYR
jgi:hypothetical protein